MIQRTWILCSEAQIFSQIHKTHSPAINWMMSKHQMFHKQESQNFTQFPNILSILGPPVPVGQSIMEIRLHLIDEDTLLMALHLIIPRKRAAYTLICNLFLSCFSLTYLNRPKKLASFLIWMKLASFLNMTYYVPLKSLDVALPDRSNIVNILVPP